MFNIFLVDNPVPTSSMEKLFQALLSIIGKAWTLITSNVGNGVDFYVTNWVFLLPIAVAFVFYTISFIRNLIKF
jgi:hypothetical protein